jgi:hypothetical protein
MPRLSFMAHDSSFFSQSFRSFSRRLLHERLFCLIPLKESAIYPPRDRIAWKLDNHVRMEFSGREPSDR